MDCNKTKKLISEFIDGKLKGKKLEEFNFHIKKCRSCAKELKDTQAALKAVKKAKEYPLPSGFFSRLSRKLDEAEEKKKGFIFDFRFNRVAGVVAACFILVLTVTVVRQVQKDAGISITGNKQAAEYMVAEKKEIKQDVAEKAQAPEMKRSALKKSKAPAAAKWEVKEAEPEMEAAADEAFLGVEGASRGVKMYSAPSAGSGSLREETAAPAPLLDSAAKKSAVRTAYRERPKEWSGPNSGVARQTQSAFKTGSEWLGFLSKYSALKMRNPDLVNVNFEKQMVIAVFSGQKPTAGYSVRIIGQKETGDRLEVYYTETSPAKGTMTAQVITYPYHIRIIEKTDKAIVFIKQ